MRGGVQLKPKNNIERNGEMQREAGAGLGWAKLSLNWDRYFVELYSKFAV